MKDISKSIQYKDKTYSLVFNLNVMQTIQAEYGSMDNWAKLTDASEPDARAVIFGITEMINEGIDIANDERQEKEPFLTMKQVGRLITEVGLTGMTQTLQEAVIDSTRSDSKNE